jgi:hypothetical protein
MKRRVQRGSSVTARDVIVQLDSEMKRMAMLAVVSGMGHCSGSTNRKSKRLT